MRTTLSLKIPKRSVTPLIAVLLLTGTVSLGTACDDDKDYSRREHIEWSNSPEFEEALTGTLHIPVRASKEQDATPFKRSIYIRSNVAYQVGFEGEKEESGELPAEEWLNVDEIKRGVRPGIDELVLLITPYTESYVERKGCISLHTDVEFLNEFIAVVQGFPKYTKDYEPTRWKPAAKRRSPAGPPNRKTKAGNRPPPKRRARPTVTAKTATSNSATTPDTEPTC